MRAESGIVERRFEKRVERVIQNDLNRSIDGDTRMNVNIC